MTQHFISAKAALLLAIGLLVQASAQATPKDEAAIRAIPESIVQGWNRADGNAIAAVYATEGTLVAGDGTVTRGRDAIGPYHERVFASVAKNTRLRVQVQRVEFLQPGIALMQTTGGMLWPGETEFAPGNRGIQTFIVVKEDGEWRIALFQNTRILPH